jgi:hypothetical protein
VISSVVEIKDPTFQIRKIVMNPLTPIEAATMLVVNSRPITKSELNYHDSDTSVIKILEQHEGLLACKGNPKKIMKFCHELNTTEFLEISTRMVLMDRIFKR